MGHRLRRCRSRKEDRTVRQIKEAIGDGGKKEVIKRGDAHLILVVIQTLL